MKRCLLTYSAWISILLLSMVACRSARVSYPVQDVAFAEAGKLTFKARITWGERELAGILLAKEIDNGNLKVAFFNELGMTYLEGLLDRTANRSELKVKNIAPAIDFKPFVKNFERCLQEAFKADHGISSIPEKIELRNHFILELHPITK